MNDMRRKNYKRRRGDRKDGRLLRSLNPFYTFIPFIMKERHDATNYIKEQAEISATEEYLRQLRNEGYKGIGMLHFFIAAYVRIVAKYPALNRFIAGQRIYARNNIVVIMTIKKELSIESGEAEVKVVFEPTDGIKEVYEKISAEIESIRAQGDDNSTERVARILQKMPRFLLRAAIRFFGWLDYHGWLPTYLTDVSPFHGSLVVTDLGSIGIPPVFHHLYNFGNIPMFLAFGIKRRAYELNADGTVSAKKYIDYTLATDERICDGYYYAQAIRYFRLFLRNPKLLGKPPKEVVEDVD